jgi:flavin-dependent dehydrogenase
LRPAVEDGVFFAGDSAGHCIPLSGEGIRTAFHFGIAAGTEIRSVIEGRSTHAAALDRYGAFSDSHRHFYSTTLFMQRLLPAMPPRLLSVFLAAMSRPAFVRRAFGWYLGRTAVRPGATGRPGSPA